MTSQFLTECGLDAFTLPRHVGIIMDGNGRWAQARRLPRVEGHRKGVERVRELTENAARLGIESLTLFAFSEENWQRPAEEVAVLMGLMRWGLRTERQRLISCGFRFRLLGDRRRLDKSFLSACERLEAQTRHNGGMCLNVAVSYGGRGELVRAAKLVAKRVAAGELDPEDLNEALFEQHLDTGDLPPCDLVIRTSGEQRISNFLLWQAAYAELVFVETHWPDFDTAAFVSALKTFAGRQRRFGMTQEQALLQQQSPKAYPVAFPSRA